MQQELQYPLDTTRVRGGILHHGLADKWIIFVVHPNGGAFRHEMSTLEDAEDGFHFVYPDGYLVPQWVINN